MGITSYIPIPTLHIYTSLQYNYTTSTYIFTSLLIPIHIPISWLIGGRLYRLVILLHHYNYTILKRFLYIFHYCYSLLIHSWGVDIITIVMINCIQARGTDNEPLATNLNNHSQQFQTIRNNSLIE